MTLRQAQVELLVHDGHRQRRDTAATLATTQRILVDSAALADLVASVVAVRPDALIQTEAALRGGS